MTFCSSSVGNVYVGRLFSYWTSGSANMSSDCKIDDADSNSIHASPAAAACKETCGRERLIGCTCIVRTGPEHDQLMERTLTWAWQRSMGNSCEAPPGTGQHLQSTVPTQKAYWKDSRTILSINTFSDIRQVNLTCTVYHYQSKAVTTSTDLSLQHMLH